MKRIFTVAYVALWIMTTALSDIATAQSRQNLDPVSARAYSLYFENFKAKNYVDAIPELHWILDNDPGFPRNTDVNFDRGVELYEELAKATEDAAQKREYLDSALVILDRAIPDLQEAEVDVDVYGWTLRKGRFIQAHVDALEDIKAQAIEAYWACYRMDAEKLDTYYIDVLIGDMYTNGDLGGALDLLREINESRGEEDAVKGLVEKYFTVIPPGEQIAFLEEELEKKPGDPDIILQLFALYQQEAYYDETLALAPQVLELSPTPETLRLVSKMYLDNGNADEAMAVFEQLRVLPDIELVAQDFYNMGIAHQELEGYGQAASFFRQALDVDPELNDARLATANLYATAASTCGIDDREDAAVFWLIADAYSRAGDAAGVARMRTAFPTAEDIFYVQKWTQGQITQVRYTCRGLTISGTTIVRQQ